MQICNQITTNSTHPYSICWQIATCVFHGWFSQAHEKDGVGTYIPNDVNLLHFATPLPSTSTAHLENSSLSFPIWLWYQLL